MSETTRTRKTDDGTTEYFCANCQAWTKGNIVNVTGYSELICEGCDTTLQGDIYGFKAAENE